MRMAGHARMSGSDVVDTKELTVLSLCTGRSLFMTVELVLPVGVLGRMFALGKKLKVVEGVVRPVAVLVVDVVTRRDRSIRGLPHIPVQECSLTVRPTVVPIGSAGVLVTIKHDEGERFDGSHSASPSSESLVDGLPTDAKSNPDLREAESLPVKFVHALGRLDVWFTAHVRSVTERLANVNLFSVKL